MAVVGFGMKVKLRRSIRVEMTLDRGMVALEDTDLVLRNVTEIHYNYNFHTLAKVARVASIGMTAFESDVHCTGLTIPTNSIVEFETLEELREAPEFEERTRVPQKPAQETAKGNKHGKGKSRKERR